MRKESFRLTTAQFAELHEINKRTLHYYDSIGLFSPDEKGENGYRYYDVSQSLYFEYIRMLKELNMDMKEISAYIKNPNPEDFLRLVELKSNEIDARIKQLRRTKKILREKGEQVKFCENLRGQEVGIEAYQEETLLAIPYDFADNRLEDVFSRMKDTWSLEQIRMGIGCFISVDKVMERQFERYDGLFTPAINRCTPSKSIVRPAGEYLCGYQKGSWDKLPALYHSMVAYAAENHLRLAGYAYEMGLNEFVIADENEYVTKIMIKIE